MPPETNSELEKLRGVAVAALLESKTQKSARNGEETRTKRAVPKKGDAHFVPTVAAFFAYVCYFVWVFYGQLHEKIFRRFYNPRVPEPPVRYIASS
jgi:hypothetical protein